MSEFKINFMPEESEINYDDNTNNNNDKACTKKFDDKLMSSNLNNDKKVINYFKVSVLCNNICRIVLKLIRKQ